MRINPASLNGRERALVEIGAWLRSSGYHFVTPTPETHRRVNARPASASARDIRDIFGWSRAFDSALLPPAIVGLLHEAEAVEAVGAKLRSLVRFSSLEGQLFSHSAYPTEADSSVFFGPDTYRFAAFVGRELARLRAEGFAPSRVIDIGCGSGAGGILAARRLGGAGRTFLADINPLALQHAAANAALSGVGCTCLQSDVLASAGGTFDLILSNPPYMADPAARAYRDGGARHGSELSLRIARESLARLAPGGALLLYTGAAVVGGVDVFRNAVEPLVAESGASFRYVELDPDVFGEELERPGYASVERIAVVGMIAQRPAATHS